MANTPTSAQTNSSSQLLAILWAIFILLNEFVLNVFFESIPDTLKEALKKAVTYTGFPAWQVWLFLGLLELLILSIPILWIFFQNQKEEIDPYYAPMLLRPYPSFVRFVFRWLPFLDVKQAYFAPLRRGLRKNFKREGLKKTFSHYLVPHQDMYELYVDLLQKNKHTNVTLANKVGEKKKIKAQLELTKLETNQEKDALSVLLKVFLKGENEHVLILADSGMGKTTFLQKLYYEYARTYPAENLAFVYAGDYSINPETGDIEDTLTRLKKISKEAENRENTILFLDGFDEDRQARANLKDYIKREGELSNLLRGFKQVIITCRMSFFASEKEEWYGLEKGMPFSVLELKGFTKLQVWEYVENQYNKNNSEEWKKAKTILEKDKHLPKWEKAKEIMKNGGRLPQKEHSSFFQKPLLLSFFENLIPQSDTVNVTYLCDIYRVMIQNYLQGEAMSLSKDNTVGDIKEFPLKVIQYAKELVYQLDEKHTINIEKLEELAENAHIDKITVRNNTLLTKDFFNQHFLFSHPSFEDYFLALRLLEGDDREEGKIEVYNEEICHFYNEMCWLYYAEETNNPHLLELNDTKTLAKHYDKKVIFCQNMAIRAMMIKHIEEVKKQEYVHWHDWVAFLYQHIQENPFARKHYVFYDWEKSKEIIASMDNRAKPLTSEYAHTIAENPYFLLFFLLEDTYWATLNTDSYTGVFPNTQQKKYKTYYPVIPWAIDFGLVLATLLHKNPLLKDKYETYTSLDFQNLNIQNLDFLADIQGLSSQLQSLNLAHNRIADTSSFEGKYFPHLSDLDLSRNEIKDMINVAYVFGINLIKTYPNISHNRITENIDENADYRKLTQPIFPPQMAFIAGDSFLIGQDRDKIGIEKYEGEEDYMPQNTEKPTAMTIPSFYLGKFAVTVGEFRRFAKVEGNYKMRPKSWEEGKIGSYLYRKETNDYFFKEWQEGEPQIWEWDVEGNLQIDDNQPVIHVSWYDAVAYCNWLSKEVLGIEEKELIYQMNETDLSVNIQNDKKGYRLPSSSEWEFAARERGREVRFGNGKDEAIWEEINFNASLDSLFKHYTKDEKGYRANTVAVGSLPPNTLGLYEMSGNVWEWCNDDYPGLADLNYENHPKDGNPFIKNNNKNMKNTKIKLLRGGSWNNNPVECRASYRFRIHANYTVGYVGFRIVCRF